MTIEGYVHEVADGTLYGHIFADGEEYEMEMPFEDVPECQRQYIQSGSYFTLINGGYMLVSKTMWTTHGLEVANAEADRLWRALGWEDNLPHPN